VISHQEYSEEYYRDFWAYGVQRRGPEFLTMVRPWDESYHFPGRFFARPEHTPVGWVGDNRRDWVGLHDALDHIFRSAAAGYTVIGSDIGGYLDRDDRSLTTRIDFDAEVLARWTAMSALMPFFQLHGRANLAPWSLPERSAQIEPIYRYYATLHHELVPYLYSEAQRAQQAKEAMLHPIGPPESWPGDYRFLVGEAFLVAPILEAGAGRAVELPAGARWIDWWDLGGPILDPGVIQADAPLARIPIYLREGAIVPLAVSSTITGLLTSEGAPRDVVLVWPGPSATRFLRHDLDGGTTAIEARAGATGAEITLSRSPAPVILWVRSAPAAVEVDGAALTELGGRGALEAAVSGWIRDGATAWIKLDAAAEPRTVRAR
jgi:alpha-glucosidase (family GH31 glycosyl hydrolase)